MGLHYRIHLVNKLPATKNTRSSLCVSTRKPPLLWFYCHASHCIPTVTVYNDDIFFIIDFFAIKYIINER